MLSEKLCNSSYTGLRNTFSNSGLTPYSRGGPAAGAGYGAVLATTSSSKTRTYPRARSAMIRQGAPAARSFRRSRVT